MEITIKEINVLLIKRFGLPYRNKLLPDPVDMLIATILSQNTNDKNSWKAYNNLKSNYKSWEELSNVTRAKIENHIKVAGLGLQKSKAIKNFLTEIVEKRGIISLEFIRQLNIEDAISELTNFKGVGVKTASCVLLFSLDVNICPVDTHVHRTLNRIGIAKQPTPDKTFWEINKHLPNGIAHQFHTNLIRLGREICKPKNPSCGICPLNKICKYEDKNLNENRVNSENKFFLLDNISNS